MEDIDKYYFIRCGKEQEERFCELEQMLQGYEDRIQIQYSFPYITTVAAKIEEKSIIEELVQEGYMVEKQHVLRQLDAEQPGDIIP